MDLGSATITAPRTAGMRLLQQLEANGVAVKQIDLQGRFHHADHLDALQRLIGLCASAPMLRFPVDCRPVVPLRRNDTGQVVTADTPLHEMALQCILTEKADWHTTMASSVEAMAKGAAGSRKSKPRVLLLGPVDCIPRSLLTTSSLQLIRPLSKPSAPEESLYSYPDESIAVVGVSCRFPASKTPLDFWDTIRTKKSMSGVLPEERGYSTKGSTDDGPLMGSFLETAGSFDHSFFRKSPREALYMDPQHRLALQLAYEALESGGYFSPSSSSGTADVGCYIGLSSSDYQDNVNAQTPSAFSFTGTARAFSGGRISHFFGLTGPSMVVDTACSSSAVAIHTACKAIQSGECAMALAGGINLITSPKSHQNLAGASFLSPNGQCRPFDESADGYCRGEGGGFVLLKKLSSAVADNDRILGVVVGSATNSSRGNTSITVPSAQSQSALYRHALDAAGMHPLQVSYVEAHGTGTQKGDPIECQSIRSVFGRQNGEGAPLRFGSVKGNIGHSEAASGVASLVKVLLMLQHRQIAPQASFSVLNPSIPSLKEVNMEIPLQLQPWKESFRAACVNNYGASGSNAVMIVCRPPAQPASAFISTKTSKHPFILAAHSTASLRENRLALLSFIKSQHDMPEEELLPSIAFHLAQRQNPLLGHRMVFSAATIDELEERLNSQGEESMQVQGSPKPVVLLFAGQSGHRPRLSEEAYHGSYLLRHHLDRCDRTLQSMGLRSLFPHVFGTDPIGDLVDLHCMIFSLQYASAASWIDAGLQVNKVVGHSLGQLTGLCVAGVLTLRDALKVISGRASLIQRKWGRERGCMLSVDADPNTVHDISRSMDGSEKVEIACYNSSSNHVVVGSGSAITAFENESRARGIATKRLAITHGFHSHMLDCILHEYELLLQDVVFHPMTIPLEPCSKSASSWANITPELVALQSREPVYFGDAISRVERELGSCIWIEAGAGSTAVAMARRALPGTSPSSHSLYSIRLHGPDPMASLADVTLNLWNEGVRVQFWPFHVSQRSCFKTLELPPYQFQANHHWLPYIEAQQEQSEELQQPAPEAPKLVSFIRRLDDAAEFSINQDSDEYLSLVQGRTVLGHTLSPASAWLESAARALSLLAESSGQLSVEQVKLHAPFGLDPERRLRLTLRKQAAPSWEFAVTSHTLDNDEGVLQASGRITTQEKEHHQLGQLRRLVDYDRCQRLRQEPEASVVQGAFVKKVLGHAVNYDDAYFGIRSITSRGLEAAADVSIPEVASQWCATTKFNPPVLDNFVLVAEMHANNLEGCTSEEMYVCNGIDAVMPDPDSKSEGPWTVYSKLERVNGKAVVSDIFVFDARQRTLCLAILGARFSKVPIRSFQNTLDAVNGAGVVEPTAGFVTPEESLPVTVTRTTRDASPASPSIQAQKEPSNVGSSALLEVEVIAKGLLHEITGVPIDCIDDATGLGDFGVDSLVAIELQARIKDGFHVDLPVRQYCEQDMTFGKMYREIHSRLNRSHSPVSSASSSSPSRPSTSDSADSSALSSGQPPTPPSFETQGQEQMIVALSNLLAEHLNCPDGISPDTPLGDLGLDSLVAIQLKSDVQQMFGKKINLTGDETPTFSELCDAILDNRPTALTSNTRVKPHSSSFAIPETSKPSLFVTPATLELERVSENFGDFAQDTGFAGFYSGVYQKQMSLVVAYIVEAFSTLGCDLTTLQAGDPLPLISYLPKYQRLVSSYHRVLENAGLVSLSDDESNYHRTAKPLPHHVKASQRHRQILADYPQHRPEHQLLHVTGSRLADCLSGAADPLALLFHDKTSRQLLEDVYVRSPMFATGTKLLAALLQQLLLARPAGRPTEPLRILEIGAGTGATTMHLLDQVLLGGGGSSVAFSYTFTDISVALVAAARKKLAARYGEAVVAAHMAFAVLDVERAPPPDMRGAFHLVVSSNCIHATKDIRASSRNLQRLLRDDGALCLLELTRPLAWLDCVFGLLDGWWRFEDDREYVLADERRWESVLLDAGFGRVEWTDDESKESDQFRLIVGLKSGV